MDGVDVLEVLGLVAVDDDDDDVVVIAVVIGDIKNDSSTRKDRRLTMNDADVRFVGGTVVQPNFLLPLLLWLLLLPPLLLLLLLLLL